MTIAELVQLLKQKYDEYLINPDFSIYLVSYRPVKTLLLGEVVRPGFYTLGGLSRTNTGPIRANSEADQKKLLNIVQASRTSEDLFPTLYDAIRLAGGITLYSDLKNIEVIRKNTLSNGGGNIKTNINLLSLLQDGDQSQNIRIYDGDTIIIKKSSEKIGKQIVQARKTNLNSATISVYVGGNVKNPGKRVIPTGAGLNQAVELAGGRDLFSGNVAFIRFDNDGNIQKRNIRYNRNAKINSYKNPQLADGDIINVSDSILGKTTAVFGEIANPLVGAYGLYGIIEDILD